MTEILDRTITTSAPIANTSSGEGQLAGLPKALRDGIAYGLINMDLLAEKMGISRPEPTVPTEAE